MIIVSIIILLAVVIALVMRIYDGKIDLKYPSTVHEYLREVVMKEAKQKRNETMRLMSYKYKPMKYGKRKIPRNRKNFR